MATSYGPKLRLKAPSRYEFGFEILTGISGPEISFKTLHTGTKNCVLNVFELRCLLFQLNIDHVYQA